MKLDAGWRRILAALAVAAVVVIVVASLTGGGGGGTSSRTGPPPPMVIRVNAQGKPNGGLLDSSYILGDRVRINVDSAVADDVVVSGYGIRQPVRAGGKTSLDFRADRPGSFRIEMAHAGEQIAFFTVERP